MWPQNDNCYCKILICAHTKKNLFEQNANLSSQNTIVFAQNSNLCPQNSNFLSQIINFIKDLCKNLILRRSGGRKNVTLNLVKKKKNQHSSIYLSYLNKYSGETPPLIDSCVS